ncbi:MAG TPA: porin [Bacteroidota bacterium]
MKSAVEFRNRGAVVVLGIVLTFQADAACLAQDSAKVLQPSKVEVSGFVDAYYSENVAQPTSRTNRLRNFDISENQFNLSLVEVVFQKKAEPVGFRLDLDYGTANDVVQQGVTGTASLLQQAYLTVVIPLGNGLTVDAGKFVTHMGYEVMESKDNANYSRSLLFAWAIPYYHTGMRITYTFSHILSATFHIVNGWNSGIDNNGSKSIGLALNCTPLFATNIVLNLIAGHENLTHIEYGARNVADLVVNHQLSDAVSLGLNADYGEAQTSNGLLRWKGAAIYGRCSITDKTALAVRGEIFDDPEGYAVGLSPKSDIKEITGTYEYKFADALLLRGELRDDFSNVPAFDKKATQTSSGIGTETTQLTFLVSAVVSF